MKRFLRPAIIVLISLALALTSAALTHLVLPPGTGNNLSAAAFFLQTTPTPEQVDRSEVGSTDGIVVMGFLLVAIILVPILIRRKVWSQPQ